MAINKIIYGGETLIDLTPDTATADRVLSGFTYHGNDGLQHEGTCTFDSDTSDATAQVAEVLKGKSFYANGAKKTGTMTNNGAVSGKIATKDGSYTIPQGFHDGSGSVVIDPTAIGGLTPQNIREGVNVLGIEGTMSGSEDVKAQSRTVTPTKAGFEVNPESGYNYLTSVTVNPIPYVETANSYGTTVSIG